MHLTSVERATLRLRSAEKILAGYRDMAVDLHMLDFRPILFVPATGEVTRVGDFSLPPALTELMTMAARDVAICQQELVTCVDREREYRQRRPVDRWLVGKERR